MTSATVDSAFDRYFADDMRYLLDFARASAITTDGNSRIAVDPSCTICQGDATQSTQSVI
jgi:thiaminase